MAAVPPRAAQGWVAHCLLQWPHALRHLDEVQLKSSLAPWLPGKAQSLQADCCTKANRPLLAGQHPLIGAGELWPPLQVRSHHPHPDVRNMGNNCHLEHKPVVVMPHGCPDL